MCLKATTKAWSKRCVHRPPRLLIAPFACAGSSGDARHLRMRRRAASWATELAAIQSVDAASAVDKACLSVLFADAESKARFCVFQRASLRLWFQNLRLAVSIFWQILNIAHMPARVCQAMCRGCRGRESACERKTHPESDVGTKTRSPWFRGCAKRTRTSTSHVGAPARSARACTYMCCAAIRDAVAQGMHRYTHAAIGYRKIDSFFC